MQDEIHELWNRHSVNIRAIPVRDMTTRRADRDSFIALVRIDRDGVNVVDWHLPRLAQRWASAAEAQREAFDYAVKAINAGFCGETRPRPGPAVANEDASPFVRVPEGFRNSLGDFDHEHGTQELESI
ncbi:DUF6566 family protein [Caballeronia sp. dw_19]|uniref:DUF6566 family protein n=1 Tax=Caballeronia sp. dw_19 TaxID=2719791 RepID=UPI002107C366|nr:DUF6566 family protein [Caballeronia sp. dw_19]